MANEARLIGWLKLARCRGLAPSTPARLVELAGGAEPFSGSPVRSPEAIAAIAALGASDASDALDGSADPEQVKRRLDGVELQRRAERELRLLERLGAHVVHRGGDGYPAALDAIAVPPPVLTIMGDPSIVASAGPAVAVVGSRRPSGYGLSMTDRLVRPLAALAVRVVSGLALGIDAKAHRVALEERGPTIAVLGTGIDVTYPRRHARLAEAIAESGALVSEFPPGTPPLPRHFPQRNRVIVGLSLACVVVEGAERSGSLVTARWAQEEGRPVLAVPGRVGDPASAGPLSLLRVGAALATSAEDVLAELPPELRPSFERADGRDDAPTRAAEARLALCLESSPLAREILSLLPAHDAVHVDDLIERSRHGTADVLETLFSLELRGLIETVPGGSVRRSAAGAIITEEGPAPP